MGSGKTEGSTSRRTPPAAVWKALNERQRVYLREAFALDQETEAGIASRRAHGWFDEPPASVWRWLRYGYVHALDDPSDLALRLTRQGFTDEGTGSTWQALARRGLVLTRYVPHPVLQREQLLEVRLTPLGRRVVRAGDPAAATPKRPAGALTEYQWRQLVRVVEAMPAGLPYRPCGYEGIGDTTLRRLSEGRDGALVEEVDPETGEKPRWGWADERAALRLTARGRAYYAAHHARYRALYPDVAAPAPETATPPESEGGAHA